MVTRAISTVSPHDASYQVTVQHGWLHGVPVGYVEPHRKKCQSVNHVLKKRDFCDHGRHRTAPWQYQNLQNAPRCGCNTVRGPFFCLVVYNSLIPFTPFVTRAQSTCSSTPCFTPSFLSALSLPVFISCALFGPRYTAEVFVCEDPCVCSGDCSLFCGR